ncbi:hypothetical protein [Chitinophaga sp. YIM B06452]|uniref:hypothetical protein n=1 Tax=Chitinophaga sp. YIM B06452 TaxID=3082158 RepID=UPI0031FEC736
MRNLKFSFALLIAIAAVGITLASKAGQIGSRVLTVCFEQVSLQNAAGTQFYSPTAGDVCADVVTDINTLNTLYLSANPATGTNIKTGCIPVRPVYCCIDFDVDPTAPSTVPNTTPNGAASGKYKIVDIRCKLQ